MSTTNYMSGRKKYSRPQAMLFADNPGTKVNGFYIPDGVEIGALEGLEATNGEFLILSDDNRSPIEFKQVRIEKRERMINGRMRSYHIADKLQIVTSYDNLPSRAYDTKANFNSDGDANMLATIARPNPLEFTTDGGAGGVELLDWYEKHNGSFWVYLSYDKYTNFEDDILTEDVDDRFNNLNKYNEIIEVFFSDFSYTVKQRSGLNFDFWNVSFTLDEV